MWQYVLDLVNSPSFPAAVLGAAVPFVFAFVAKEGVELSTRVKYGINVFLCTAVAMIPMLVRWKVSGLPPAEDFWHSIIASLTVSQSLFLLYVKPRQDAAAGSSTAPPPNA
jgi:hypothetical protein